MANQKYNETGSGFDTQFDNRLLGERGDKQAGAAEKGSSEKAGDFRAAKRNTDSEADDNPETEEQADIGSALQSARSKKAASAQESESSGLQEAAAAPIRKGTSQLLRSAWTNLIPSWGLTLIWINIHVFLGMIFGNKYFCKLGVEWSDQISGAMAKSGEVKKKLDEKAGSSIGLVEKMGVGCADLGCLIILIAVVALIALLLQIFNDTLAFLAQNFGYIWDMAKEAVVEMTSSK